MPSKDEPVGFWKTVVFVWALMIATGLVVVGGLIVVEFVVSGFRHSSLFERFMDADQDTWLTVGAALTMLSVFYGLFQIKR